MKTCSAGTMNIAPDRKIDLNSGFYTSQPSWVMAAVGARERVKAA